MHIKTILVTLLTAFVMPQQAQSRVWLGPKDPIKVPHLYFAGRIVRDSENLFEYSLAYSNLPQKGFKEYLAEGSYSVASSEKTAWYLAQIGERSPVPKGFKAFVLVRKSRYPEYKPPAASPIKQPARPPL